MKQTVAICDRMFQAYPDLVNITQLSEMLNISRSSSYRLLYSGEIKGIKIGRKLLIPKQHVIQYVKTKLD